MSDATCIAVNSFLRDVACIPIAVSIAIIIWALNGFPGLRKRGGDSE